MKASGRQLLEGVEKQGEPGSIVLTLDDESLETDAAVVDETEKQKVACLRMLQSRMNGKTNDLGASPCYLAMSQISAIGINNLGSIKAFFWNWSHTSGRFSLLFPMAISALAILALMLSAGIALKDSLLGAIIDRRDRISLSRVQQLAWTVVLLGGYAMLGIVNVTLLAGFVRDVSQVNELPEIGGVQAGAFFPAMDPSLWAVLGLTVLIANNWPW